MKICIRKIFFFFILILYSFTGYGQNNINDPLKIDSLKKVLQTQKEDSNKVNMLNALCWKMLSKYPEIAMQYANEAFSLSEKINFKRGKATTYFNKGYAFSIQYNFPEALKNFFTASKIWQDAGDKHGIAESNYAISQVYSVQGHYPEALKNSYAALKLYEELGDKEMIASSLQLIGAVYFYQGDDSEALKNLLVCLKIREETRNKWGIAQTHNTIGSLYSKEGKYEEALKQHLAALKIFQEPGMPNWGVPMSYDGIGKVYEGQGDLYYAAEDETTAVNKFSESLKNYLAALEGWEKTLIKVAVSESNMQIGNIYIKLKKLSEAKNYLEKGLQLSITFKNKETIKDSYRSLSNLDSIQGNYKEAYAHYKMYILYRDSLINEENTKKSLQAKMQYEFDKKEAATKAAQDKKDDEAQRVKNIHYFTIAVLGIVVLAVVVIAFIQYQNNKQKQKANALLQQQKEKVESTLTELKATQEQLIQAEKKQAVSNERLRISRELHDEVGATLSSISIFSHAAIQKNESGNMADSKNILQRIGETSREVMGELNDAVWLINPRNDNVQKIIQRIGNYALPLCRTNDIHFEIKATATMENLEMSVEKRKAIYLIIKEAVNNSLKYAAAKNLVIQFEKNHEALHISIKDDGRGFAEDNSSGGNGLNNMNQRAKDVNGKIDFNSVQQKGTEIILQVPLTNIGD